MRPHLVCHHLWSYQGFISSNTAKKIYHTETSARIFLWYWNINSEKVFVRSRHFLPSAVSVPKGPRLWSLFYEKPRSSFIANDNSAFHAWNEEVLDQTQEIYHSAQITKTLPWNYNSLNYGGWNVSRSNEPVIPPRPSHCCRIFCKKNSIKTSLPTTNKIWVGLKW